MTGNEQLTEQKRWPYWFKLPAKLTLMCGKWRHSAFPLLYDQSSCKSFHCLSKHLPFCNHQLCFTHRPIPQTRARAEITSHISLPFFLPPCKGKDLPGRPDSGLKTWRKVAFFCCHLSREISARARSEPEERSSATSGATKLWLFTEKAKKLSSLYVCLEIKSSGTKGTMGIAQRPSAQRAFSFHFCMCASYGWVIRRHHMSGLAPMVMHNQWGKCFPFMAL